MGFFMTLSAVMGKTQIETETILRNHLTASDGYLNEIPLDNSTENSCIISQEKEGTCVVYPGNLDFSETHNYSLHISKELECTVLSFVIYPDEHWSFVAYQNGHFKGMFQPFQNASMNISLTVLKELLPNTQIETIQNYIQSWNAETSNQKAYPDDENNFEPWQFTDFLEKIGVEYPLKSRDTFRGKAFDFYASGQPLSFEEEMAIAKEDGTLGQIQTELNPKPEQKSPSKNKPWWKVW